MCDELIALVLQSDIQEDHQKQINGAILGAALHLRPLELLDMPLVWHAACLSRLDLDRHRQLNRSPFSARLRPHIRSLCRPQEKGIIQFISILVQTVLSEKVLFAAEDGGIVVGSVCFVCCHCLY